MLNNVSFLRMPAQADIIVSSPDSTEVKLVLEVKLQILDFPETEHQLKNYMLQVSCPLALLITPQLLWIYLDRLTSYSEDSIQLLGKFNIEGLINFSPSKQGSSVAFENAVQLWLEDLKSGTVLSTRWEADLREVVEHFILPAVETGVVRAAGPR